MPFSALALIGMVAYLTGVVQAPITSFVIVSEMTDDHAMITPLMAAALIANAASKLLSHEGLYHWLSKNYLVLPLNAEAVNKPGTTGFSEHGPSNKT